MNNEQPNGLTVSKDRNSPVRRVKDLIGSGSSGCRSVFSTPARTQTRTSLWSDDTDSISPPVSPGLPLSRSLALSHSCVKTLSPSIHLSPLQYTHGTGARARARWSGRLALSSPPLLVSIYTQTAHKVNSSHMCALTRKLGA